MNERTKARHEITVRAKLRAGGGCSWAVSADDGSCVLESFSHFFRFFHVYTETESKEEMGCSKGVGLSFQRGAQREKAIGRAELNSWIGSDLENGKIFKRLD